MHIDFSQGKIHLVIAPYDMRAGYNKLSSIALQYLNVNVDKGGHWVVFISRNRDIAKIIGHDEYGSILIIRKLNKGKFQQLLGLATGVAMKSLTPELLCSYLDGACIEVKRSNLLKN